jgi:hypothetical protein
MATQLCKVLSFLAGAVAELKSRLRAMRPGRSMGKRV